MKLFIDANVLISVFNKEYPVFHYSSKILSLTNKKGIKLYTSPVCIAISFYFATKKCGENQAKKKIAALLEHINLTTVDQECTQRAVNHAGITDLEDGIQYFSALLHECEYIITENTDDFYFGEIPALGCEDFIKQNLSFLTAS